MTVTDYLVGKVAISASEASDRYANSEGLRQLANASAVCNEAEFDASTMDLPIADRKVNGDATDSAILRFAESMSLVSELRMAWRSIFKVAFNSKNKFAIHVAKSETSDHALLMIKGAPDILLPRCSKFMSILQNPITCLTYRSFIYRYRWLCQSSLRRRQKDARAHEGLLVVAGQTCYPPSREAPREDPLRSQRAASRIRA